ncbi:hypothetical protein LPJ66_005526 [Kickxella alabastrina]|uniref:Uncharacterized protein n=1 Tax=Kickxella alabastrina TaxID=61397 RepID=A0ACC1IEZ4_9FUNG|nr:hypothetical protein LPJ66_005526 [Kickxella alabastrina]
MSNQQKNTTTGPNYAIINIPTPLDFSPSLPTPLTAKSSIKYNPAHKGAAAAADDTTSTLASTESPKHMYRNTLRIQNYTNKHHHQSLHSDSFNTPPAAKMSEFETDHHLSSISREATIRGMAGAWLNVLDAGEDTWRRISVPPGITIGQARDICMLRFNIWQRILKDQPQPTPIPPSAISSSSSTGAVSSSRTSCTSSTARKQPHHYELYWPAGSQWLDADFLLSTYGIKPGDTVILQDRDQARESSAIVETLLNINKVQQRAQSAGAEGQIYYLHAKGIATSWQLCWLVLRNQELHCYASNRAGTGPLSEKSLVVVDLSCGFRLVNHRIVGGSSSMADTTGDAASMYSDSSSIKAALSFAATATGKLQSQQMSGSSSVAPLIIRSNTSESTHVFCALTPTDHDHWRYALHMAQGPGSQKSDHSSADMLSKPRSSTIAKQPQHQQYRSSVQMTSTPSPGPLFIANAFRRHKGHSPVGFFCRCVLISGFLYGFRTIISDTDILTHVAAADFTVPLNPITVCVSRETSGNSHLIRVSDAYMGTEIMLLDVGGPDKAHLWIDALANIAGIHIAGDNTMRCNKRSQAMRQSKSHGSIISRMEWPMPPTTVPRIVPRGIKNPVVAPAVTENTSDGARQQHQHQHQHQYEQEQKQREKQQEVLVALHMPEFGRNPSLNLVDLQFGESAASAGNMDVDAVRSAANANSSSNSSGENRPDRVPILQACLAWFKRPGASFVK